MILQQVQGFLDTPSLWQNSLFEVEQFIFPEITLEGFVPKAIPQNIRLGHQVEYIFYQLIEHSQKFNIILFNQQIKASTRTIGEIDFILENKTNQELIHVELTYKFYLINPKFSDPVHQLIGPNQKDSFYAKLQKIKNKQFKLLQTKEAIKLLKESAIYANEITSKVCFKAQLFVPYTQKELIIFPFNKRSIQGFWLRIAILNSIEFKTNKFYLPTKQEWILTPYEKFPWKSLTDILKEIAQHHGNQNTPMVWMRKSEFDYEKFFVVWW